MTIQDYENLAAAAAIWILGEPLWEKGAAHHHFELVDRKNQLVLTDQCAIHFLQPSLWANAGTAIVNDEDTWPYFFRDAASWTRLPPELENLEPMRSPCAHRAGCRRATHRPRRDGPRCGAAEARSMG